jgi:hypothetical protein
MLPEMQRLLIDASVGAVDCHKPFPGSSMSWVINRGGHVHRLLTWPQDPEIEDLTYLANQ